MGQIAGGRAYNAREVYVVLGGQPITGFADGDFVGFTPSADDSAMVVGSTGDVGLAVLNDRTGVFVFGLLQGSRASRIVMETAITTYRLTGVPIPILVRDISTGETVSAAECFPMTPPASTFGAEHGRRDYAWGCAEYTRTVSPA
jgi:hypothetical protein